MARYAPTTFPRVTFSVITPTFNRATTLPRVFESLVAQTLQDFEWIVVDDGSTDQTGQLVDKWRSEVSFPVHYVHQANQGTHVAVNRGVRAASGAYCVVLDSDDACVPTALERFAFHWTEIGPSQHQFASVACLCQDQKGRRVGDLFPESPMDSNPSEMSYRYGVRGEKWAALRTEVLKEFPLPEAPEQRWVWPGVVWSAMGRKYQTRFINEMLRIFWDPDSDDMHDHLSRSFVPSDTRQAASLALGRALLLNADLRWSFQNPKFFYRVAANYVRFALHGRWGLGRQLKELRLAAWPLWAVALPAGVYAYVRDLIRTKIRRRQGSE